jgi:hypothetical protein
VSEFERCHGEMAAGSDATRATAYLPGLDIEIVHRRAIENAAEQISITLRAAPSFDALGRAFEGANPFVFWAQAAELAWQPWLLAARALAPPWVLALPRPGDDGTSRSLQERGSPG